MLYKYRKTHVATRSLSRGLIFIACLLQLSSVVQATDAEPRIVNIYNFVRENDFRLRNSEKVLWDCTVHQVQLLKQTGLPATFALQYDALMDTNYQTLFKKQAATNFEIAAWWEIPQELVEKAGLKWRGKYEWDPEANVGFSPGYTPAERRKLVDVYMADFKRIFGHYPKTVGSWYIDEVTLAYMARRYGIIASCNCKDQIGTDFYTLWGGYWNQAYYPSRLNAYMPAQTKAGQINVPIFRMLGSDPIYEHGTTPGLQSLEPVYPESGGSEPWVMWFMNNLIQQPSLAFAYAQAGQENSFGWDKMETGLTHQIELFARLEAAGKIQVETLAQSGQWFRNHFSVTPPTAVVALDDWKHQGHKTVWYDSRFYRLNMFWESNAFFIRDLHCFDEKIVSPTHETALTATSLAYETLPVMDWAQWSKSGTPAAGMWPVLLSPDGTATSLVPVGAPEVKEQNAKDLSIKQPLSDGGKFMLVCSERKITFTATNRKGQPLSWAWKLVGGTKEQSIVQSVKPNGINYRFDGTDYQLHLEPGLGTCQQLDDGSLRLVANKFGKLVVRLR